MQGKTHLAAGLLIGATMGGNSLSIISACVLGSILPDIDISTSKLGQRAKPVSWCFQHLLGHRQMLHSPLIYAVLFSLARLTSPALQQLLQPLFFGIASHLFLDMLNPTGIPLLWPIPKRFHIASLHSGGWADHILMVLLIALLIFLR
ncbi:MAG TPA: metal-dependent hydrolase [Candidatus Faecousia intestinigallinarum]|nr:metal-dependent hydrolase [Candidatus Faecousia intestinigallinarum]